MPSIQTAIVSVPRASAKGTMASYVVKPEGAGPFTGFVGIHEIFGLNDNICGMANQFLEQRYAALAADLSSNHNRTVLEENKISHNIEFPAAHAIPSGSFQGCMAAYVIIL